MTKPVPTDESLADIGRVTSRAPNTTIPVGAEPKFILPAWDTAAALSLVEGDADLVEDLAHLFAEESPKAIDQMRGALDTKNAELLERLAHTMKGSSASIGANEVSLAALALELLARSGSLETARERFDSLQTEMERLLLELEAQSYRPRS